MSRYILVEREDEFDGTHYKELVRTADNEVVATDNFTLCPEDATFTRALAPLFEELNRLAFIVERLTGALVSAGMHRRLVDAIVDGGDEL